MLLGLFGFGEAVGFKGFLGVGVGRGDCNKEPGEGKAEGRISGGILLGGGVLLVVGVGVGVGVAVVVVPPPVAQFAVLKLFNKP